MKYDLKMTKELSRQIYMMGRFDVEWAGSQGTFKDVLDHMKSQCFEKSLQACTDLNSTDRTFNGGYVKGIYEAFQFLAKSFDEGRILQAGNHGLTRPPRSV